MAKRNKPDNKGFVYSTDPSFRVEENQESAETFPAVAQKLRIRLDTKNRAGKAVTLITGFAGKEEDIEDLGRKLKASCGSGGSIKDGEIIIQGDHREKILQWLFKNGFKQAKRI